MVRKVQTLAIPWLMACLVALVAAAAPAPAAASVAAAAADATGASRSAVSTPNTAQKAAPAKRPSKRAPPRKVAEAVDRGPPSFGQLAGLRGTGDDLALKSSVALVIDQDTDEVLFSKNPQAVLPIASITKLMTALVVTEANLPLDEMLTVSQEDVVATAGSTSRLTKGTQLSRGEMLHLALMASENRAAHLLGRTYPGGIDLFVQEMNAKAAALGMHDTRYVEPTGLSSSNQSSAQDLTRLVKAASLHPIIRELSTSREAAVAVGKRTVQFRSTNGLVRSPQWDIGLQKTGYISEAGRCLVMQAQLAGRKLILVLLDSAGKYSRIGDAERIRRWLIQASSTADPARPVS
jgi:D-alanyl-D-alanine endopeptidase (penicillin-binding protein 7)